MTDEPTEPGTCFGVERVEWIHEIVWLEDFAASRAADDGNDFLFAGAPISLERGTGAPVSAMAVTATVDR